MRQNDFENTPMLKLVMGLAIPSMIAQLVNILYSIVDRMFVGQIEEVGNVCLAAVGICGPIVTLLSSFGTLVGIGGSIWLSMCMGQKNEKRASQILYNSFVMLVVLSLCLTLGFILLKHNLIYWFGGSDALYPYANTYLTIYTLGTFFALMSIGLNYFITGQGYATIAMLSVCIGAITNIVFDFILIRSLKIRHKYTRIQPYLIFPIFHIFSLYPFSLICCCLLIFSESELVTKNFQLYLAFQ